MPIPAYIQIAEDFLERIAIGELAPDERLPSERELSKTLNVSRMTVRAALRVLDNKGLLVRRTGDGTYIAQPKIERQADKLVPFPRKMQKLGGQIASRLILFERREAEVSIAKKLELPAASPVYYFQRLRLLNQESVLLEACTLPLKRFPDLEKFDLEKRSVYEVLESEYGVLPHHSNQSLEAVAATDYEAELLGLEAGVPLMLERRITFDEANIPFEYGRDLYRGDRFRFMTEIAPLE
ncbi:MAG: GntR family transcriptional regulator [Anaerolineales bacterium]|nr:GntR family transcriptional regulator [Anaerolineales bacterium]